MKNLVVAIFLFGSFMAIGQQSLNQYKYIIVPKKFDGFRKENQYQTSTIIKHLLSQRGFNVVYDDALPNDLNTNRCLGLTTVMDNGSSMFSTKVVVHLKNCDGVAVMTTIEGKSKKKDFKASYREAIQRALTSFDMISYKYTPKKEESEQVTLNFNNDVKKLENEKKEAKNRPGKGVVQEVTTERQTYKDNAPVESEFKKAESTDQQVVEQIATTENQSYKSYEPESSEMKKANPEASSSSKSVEGVLYAQEVPNGYQLVDSTPQIKLFIYKTSLNDYFLAESGATHGIVYKTGDKWFFEYYENEKLFIEELNIKF